MGTHGIRPKDLDGRRVSIVLRHVYPNAPRVGQEEEAEQKPSHTWSIVDQPVQTNKVAPPPPPDPPVPKAHSKLSKQPRLQLDDVDEFGRRLRRETSDASETVEVEKATGLTTKMSEKQ